MKDRNFNFFMPIEFEKASEGTNHYKNMIIGGVASTNDIDYDEEILEPGGFDLSVLKVKGTINWEHGAKNSASNIIGEPIEAEVKNNKLFLKAKLYEKMSKARDAYDTMLAMKESGATRGFGFSIEGKPLQRDPGNPKRITKALVTNVALCMIPKNSNTWASIIKGVQQDDFIKPDYDIPQDVDYLFKGVYGDNEYTLHKDFTITKALGEGSRGGRVIGHTKSGKPIYARNYHPKQEEDWSSEDHSEASKRHQEESEKYKKLGSAGYSNYQAHAKEALRHKNKEGIQKAFAAGLISKEVFEKAMSAGAETGQQLIGQNTSGAALKKESLDPDLKILTIPISTVHWAADNWDNFKEDTKKAIQKAFHNMIEKGGEGSRGGKIIGHTKSGKPIYEEHRPMHENYKNFTSEEHIEASRLHRDIATKTQSELSKHSAKYNSKNPKEKTKQEHEELSRKYKLHSDLANHHYGFGK
jgi:hypothetical protein